MSKFKKRLFNDFGLGSKSGSKQYRALNKDGTFNVSKTHLNWLDKLNVFHALISMSWVKFIGLIIVGYFTVNTLFASLYLVIGIEHLTGISETSFSKFDHFLEAFFFSAQTITTLGYGRVAPVGTIANVIAATESMLGLLGFALATGLLYGRFSRPSSKLKFSTHAVVAPYQDINGFMFRVINPRKNQLLEVEAQVSVSFNKKNTDQREFHALELERSSVMFFPSVWTVVHPIDEKSPLNHFTEKDLLDRDAEFIVAIKMFDESFAQTVYSRSSFKADEIKWGQKFTYIIERTPDGIRVNVNALDFTEAKALNVSKGH